MRDFKFFSDNDDDDESIYYGYDGASWIYGRLENLDQYRFEIVHENHYGIHSFLNNFPPAFIVTILSITGPNGLRHTIDNEGAGWGFEITRDLITIEWIRFIV